MFRERVRPDGRRVFALRYVRYSIRCLELRFLQDLLPVHKTGYDRSSVRQKRDPKEIGISSVRGGSIVGDHEVLFCGPDEVITLKHTAYSRNIFANGAVNAAVYLAKKEPGLYNMGNMIAEL